ncbi:acyltransferase family protein [Streptomyces sp. NRRL B-24484]|uniref:acyltransferase family protein n=1 Tax=Streptomyces sp. NRRL B-24484 TaxID=1463833 RepID=UPI001F3D2A18|nr:acyltransferase [Streptomyces sp. NRRL B-24484]
MRYVDFLRGAAIVVVVLGHWVITALVRHPDGTISAPELLATVEWAQWLTLVFQIMPVFFLAGGHAAAGSWRRHREGGGGAAGWVRGRAVRLLLPTTAYVGIAVACLAAARAAGADPGLLGTVGWALAMQFWFLPVYLVVSALTPWLYAASRRWGLASTAALAALAVVVDVVDLAGHGSPVGAANHVLVWAVAYQLGFGWEDGRLPGRRPLLWTVAGCGAAAFAGLVAYGPFPVALIRVSTEEVGNTDPPSVAMLAWVLAQCALCLLAAPAMERALRAEWLWRLVRPLGRVSMTLYLWHMVPVLAAAAAFYLTDVAPEPPVGSGVWWAWRPVWIAVLTLFLLGLLLALRPVERGLLRVGRAVRPQAEVRGPLAVLAGLAGLVCAIGTLTVRAGEGLAAGGHSGSLDGGGLRRGNGPGAASAGPHGDFPPPGYRDLLLTGGHSRTPDPPPLI